MLKQLRSHVSLWRSHYTTRKFFISDQNGSMNGPERKSGFFASLQNPGPCFSPIGFRIPYMVDVLGMSKGKWTRTCVSHAVDRFCIVVTGSCPAIFITSETCCEVLDFLMLGSSLSLRSSLRMLCETASTSSINRSSID